MRDRADLVTAPRALARTTQAAGRAPAWLGLFAILFQAILFGWHHHPLPLSSRGTSVVVSSAQQGNGDPDADFDHCQICFALTHHNAAPVDSVPATPIGHLVTPLAIARPIVAARSPYLLFHSRAPPPA